MMFNKIWRAWSDVSYQARALLQEVPLPQHMWNSTYVTLKLLNRMFGMWWCHIQGRLWHLFLNSIMLSGNTHDQKCLCSTGHSMEQMQWQQNTQFHTRLLFQEKCRLCQSYKTHKYPLQAKCTIFSFTEHGT